VTPELWTMAAAGALVSATGTVVGAGGGFLMVPLLQVAFGVEMHTAVSASLAAIFPAAVFSTAVNLYRGRVDLRLAGALEVGAVVAAVGGAAAAHALPGATLRTAFGLVVGALGLRLTLAGQAAHLEGQDGEVTYRVSVPGAIGVGGVAGFLAGLLGIGGGFLKSPALVHVFRVPARVAAATSLATVAVTSGVGAFSHYRLGHLDPGVTGAITGGFLVGALVANLGDRKLADESRRKLIAWSLLAAGLVMLLPVGR